MSGDSETMLKQVQHMVQNDMGLEWDVGTDLKVCPAGNGQT